MALQLNSLGEFSCKCLFFLNFIALIFSLNHLKMFFRFEINYDTANYSHILDVVMIFIILCILSVIFFFFITITVLKMRETWIYETKSKPLSQKFRNIQAAFRKQVLPLEGDDIINASTKQRLTTIATNFFVFQTLNEDNIARLLFIVESCKGVFEQCLQANANYPDQLPEVFEQFMDYIPVSARDFDADFYDYSLPQALETLTFSIQKLSKKSFIDDEVLNNNDDEEEFDIFKEQARVERQKQLLENNDHSTKKTNKSQ